VPTELREALKGHQMEEYEQVVRQRNIVRISERSEDATQSVRSTLERRTTMQPKLAISKKPVSRPLNY
jgi:hypothetical protein